MNPVPCKRGLSFNIIPIFLISEGLTVPTAKCCHRDYAPYCCSDIPVCADGGNVTVEKVVFKSDPCSTPWNLSACMLGYYSTNGLDILPCPAGLYVSKYEYRMR